MSPRNAPTSRSPRFRALAALRGYGRVFAFKCGVTGEIFQIYGRPNEDNRARLGVALSKRIIAKAVDRNYCKRLAREYFRQEQGVLMGFDFVVRPRRAITRSMYDDARAELRDSLARLCKKCTQQRRALHGHG